MTSLRVRVSERIIRAVGLPDIDILADAPPYWDYSDTNRPWAYSTANDWEQRLPAGIPVVDLSTSGATFWDKLNNTVNAQSGRFICRLPAGRHILSSFRLIGSSGDVNYAFGFWFPKLAGFTGPGADLCSIEMAANSMTQAQVERLSQMSQASFEPNQMGLCRIDSSASQPGFIGGLTFRAANQNPLTSINSDITNNVKVPQPAPHHGVVLYNTGKMTLSHVRFEAAGKAMMSQPPFEQASLMSARGDHFIYRCEFDGRLSGVYDSARPRKSSNYLLNGEVISDMRECWMHHSNVSRYAANDQNVSRSALAAKYLVTRCKAEQITNTQNDGNGGFTNASLFGWESTNAEIVITDCIILQDNPVAQGQVPMHLQLTSVASVDPQGGRLRVRGGIFRNSGFPTVDKFLTIRATTSFWVRDGYDTTMFVYPNADGSGTRKQPWNYTGTWPPTAAQIAAAGVTPETHYIVRG